MTRMYLSFEQNGFLQGTPVYRYTVASDIYTAYTPGIFLIQTNMLNMNHQEHVLGFCLHISHTQQVGTYVAHIIDSGHVMLTHINTAEKPSLVGTIPGVIPCLLLPFLVCSFNSSFYTYTELTILTIRTTVLNYESAHRLAVFLGCRFKLQSTFGSFINYKKTSMFIGPKSVTNSGPLISA